MVIAGLVIGIVIATQADRIDVRRAASPDAGPSIAEGSTGGGGSGGTTGSGSDQGSGGDPSTGPSTGPAMGLATAGVMNSVGGGRVVALTFSSGPDAAYTRPILDILEHHDVVATFCMIGEEVRLHPEIVADVASRHTLCSQGDSQDYHLADRADVDIQKEMRDALDAIEAAAPTATVPFFRAPGGGFTPDLNQVAETYGHDPLGWNVDPRDWDQDSAEEIVEAVMATVEPGSIILLHDGDGDRSATVAALGMLIDRLQRDGYEFTVPMSR